MTLDSVLSCRRYLSFIDQFEARPTPIGTILEQVPLDAWTTGIIAFKLAGRVLTVSISPSDAPNKEGDYRFDYRFSVGGTISFTGRVLSEVEA